jgi:asparagine synthase (glutamine-hydrolysing)
MSGLFGICQPGRVLDSSVLEPMIKASALEGEKGRRVSVGATVALGVSERWEGQEIAEIPGVRLAIDADLYNVPELKAWLTARGHDAKEWPVSRCLAHLYEIEGIDFLQRLHGVLSIAIWDERSQRLLLAIDRMGAKGLYWCEEGGRLLFATRLGAICTSLETTLELNPAALPQYLLFSVVPHPLTIYKNVQKLAPATVLVYEKGEIRQKRYWDLEYVERTDWDENQWAQEVQDGMRTAVHLHSDGSAADKIGAYLSGGTDSSSVVAFLNESHSPVNTFSIHFGEAAYSEANFARTTAAHFRTKHHEKQLGARDAFEAISKIVQFYDEPFANSSAIGAYHCAALAREAGVTTLLAGDGGDELFGGNSRYADDKRFALYHSLPAWLRRSLIEPLAQLLPESDGKLSLPRKYVRRAQIPNPRRVFSYNFFLNMPPEEVFSEDFLTRIEPDSWMNIADEHFNSVRASSELNRLLYMDVKIILADNDLRKVSGTAELAGMRVRYPLLDYRLAELSSRIPTELKLKGFEKRYIFKQAMKQILPHEVLYKKKHGFGVPLGLWLLKDRQLNELMRDVLLDSRTRQRGYFRPSFYDELLSRHGGEYTGFYGEIVWYLLVFELWHRRHFDVVSSGVQCVQ